MLSGEVLVNIQEFDKSTGEIFTRTVNQLSKGEIFGVRAYSSYSHLCWKTLGKILHCYLLTTDFFVIMNDCKTVKKVRKEYSRTVKWNSLVVKRYV